MARKKPEFRACSRCSERKLLTEFPTRTRGSGLEISLVCFDCTLDRFLQTNFHGFTLEEYNRKFEEQDGKCKICRKEPISVAYVFARRKRFAIDHCHICMTVRDLLCDNCNMALGLFEDNLEILKRAVAYLTEWQCHDSEQEYQKSRRSNKSRAEIESQKNWTRKCRNKECLKCGGRWRRNNPHREGPCEHFCHDKYRVPGGRY